MSLLNMPQELTTIAQGSGVNARKQLIIEALGNEHQDEVLAFLAPRPLHTVFMGGFIRDNGLVSPLNRGAFYACRNSQGHLEGVALIGHATLVETRSEQALAAFARFAQDQPLAHIILGEQEKIDLFWNYYSMAGQTTPRLVCREVLFEKRWAAEICERTSGLRQATPEDLPQVIAIQAQMAFEESGINPLETDPVGFRLRCARRLNKGRVWVWAEGDRVIFKADVMADTPDAMYLEGVYVAPRDRGKGYGRRCLSQLCEELLTRTGSICLLVNEQNQKAQSFYRRAGFEACSYYDTIFLHQKN